VKQDGTWRCACVREGHDHSLSPHERLKPLEWLAGDWVDESGDAVVHAHADWSKDKNFLLREFTVHVRGNPEMSVTERIGWDPLTRQIKSWVFDSEGGHGEGLWAREADRWVIRSTGVTPEGRVAAATHVITRKNDHEYRWASLDRIIAGHLVPGKEEYVMVRRPPAPQTSEARK
jgi:hypothetical protein